MLSNILNVTVENGIPRALDLPKSLFEHAADGTLVPLHCSIRRSVLRQSIIMSERGAASTLDNYLYCMHHLIWGLHLRRGTRIG